MNKKTTGLAGFVKKPSAAATDTLSQASVTAAPAAAGARRKRGSGDTVALTVRLPRGDWMRVHQLAMDEGASIQELAVRGLNKLFEERGLPGISES